MQALVPAEITSAGTADSFLRASHVSGTRRVHQVTATMHMQGAADEILTLADIDVHNQISFFIHNSK